MKKLGLLLALLVAVVFAAPMSAQATDVNMTVYQLVKGGSTATYTSSGLSTSNTYQFQNDGRIFVHFKKTGANQCIVTVTTPGTSHGLTVADQYVYVEATTGDVFAGPFPISLFNNASGNVQFTVSETTSLSFTVLRL